MANARLRAGSSSRSTLGLMDRLASRIAPATQLASLSASPPPYCVHPCRSCDTIRTDQQTRRCQRNRKLQRSDGCGSIVPNPCAAFRPRTGSRPADVIRDLSAARTATRFAQCRESRARRTHEFARSAGRASRTRPRRYGTSKRNSTDRPAAKVSFTRS